MKTIGLLGGTSWASTPLFYNYINTLVMERLEGFHSAEIILRSIDYHDIKTCYAVKDWDRIGALLRERLLQLAILEPSCIVICNNTLHKVYDSMVADLDLAMPVIHVVEETALAAKRRGMQKLLLLGTALTMEDGFFSQTLEKHGLKVTIPDVADRALIQSIQTPLSLGRNDPEYSRSFADMLKKYRGFDGIVLGCTELPLAITTTETNIPLLNTIDIVCEAAVDFALTA